MRLGPQAPRPTRSDRRLARSPRGKRGLPTELRKLRALVAKGLAATDALWPAIRIAYDWVHRAARLLENEDQLTGSEVRHQLEELLAEMRAEVPSVGALQPAVAHFLKASASYWPGLFHTYDAPGLPRTNNVLEQFFGSVRYHHRRASGRIRASAGTVARGSVRALASAASQLLPSGEYPLRHPDLDRWRDLRQSLVLRQEARRQQGRFRKDPAAYLATLENLLTPSLPS